MFGKVLTEDGIMYKLAVTCCERFSDPIILRRRAIRPVVQECLEAAISRVDHFDPIGFFKSLLPFGGCGRRWSYSWKGRGLSAVDSTPPGAVPKYPDPGQQGNDLSRSRGDWIRSGAGLFHSGSPSPPTTCLKFSLWRDLSVWRIWGGYFGHRRSGLGGVYREWGRRPRCRLKKPTVLWTTIPPWALP